jgi:ABC-2 type transport system permease protein
LNKVRWLQMLVLLNPLVYMSEGLRTALTPSLPHMPIWASFVALTIALVLLAGIGMKGFVARILS